MIDFAQRPADALETSFLIPYYRSLPIQQELSRLNSDSISMLHPDVLALMYHLAAYGNGPVLELGPYVGGSTVALAWGVRHGKRSARIISVEIGGSYEHPTAGTDDIVRELRRNLDRYGVADRVELVIANSRDPETVRKVGRLIGTEKAGLCCIDSDGDVAADLGLYMHLLAHDAYLIIDDYFAPGAPHKVKPTREGIRAAEQRGLVQSFGVYGWGSWVGRLTGRR
jgi:predicted O-methyltransferase YrrM